MNKKERSPYSAFAERESRNDEIDERDKLINYI